MEIVIICEVFFVCVFLRMFVIDVFVLVVIMNLVWLFLSGVSVWLHFGWDWFGDRGRVTGGLVVWAVGSRG